MGLIIFFGLVIFYMIIDGRIVKKDIEAASKSKWTKKDSENYYKNFDDYQ